MMLFFATFFITNNLFKFSEIIKLQGMKNYHRPYKIAKYILDSAKNDSFSIYTIRLNEKYNHHSTSYIYALEKITGKKIAQLNEQGNWIDQRINKNVKWIYLICRDFSSNTEVERTCLNYFVEKERVNKPIEYKIIENASLYKILIF